MPLHDFTAANEEAERLASQNIFQFKLRANEHLFTVRWEIQFRYFVQAILYKPDTEDFGDMENLRPIIDVIHDVLIEEDQARFKKLIDDSERGVKDRWVDPKILALVHENLLGYFRGQRPLEQSEHSSDSPSTAGLTSTTSSPSEAATLPPPGVFTAPKYD